MSDADRFPFRESATETESDQPGRNSTGGWVGETVLTAVSGHHRLGQLQVHGTSHQRLWLSNGLGWRS